jgi:phosphatidylinositol alpha-1,6-mannosyltransferase
MRLLVFTTQFPPTVGGVETMSWQLSRHLQSIGEEVSVLTQRVAGAEVFDAGENLRIKRFQLGDSGNFVAKGRQKLSLIETLKQSVAAGQVDGVLCTAWDPCAYIASLALARSQVPYFMIAHGMELMQLPRGFVARRTKAWMRARALAGAKKIFAVSDFTRTKVISLGVAAERVSVVPNGVVISEPFDAGAGNRKLNIITTVSRLVPRKGHDTVLRALPMLLKEVPDAIYRIVGTGPQLLQLQALAQELKVDEHVEFHGKVSDLERERLLQECDVFVLATRATLTDFEGLGIAVLEAMQQGKPVVVTRAGGVPELVTEGRTGVVVEPDDPEALARALAALLAEPARAFAMGAAARLAVSERYDWNVIARRYADEMKHSLGGERPWLPGRMKEGVSPAHN